MGSTLVVRSDYIFRGLLAESHLYTATFMSHQGHSWEREYRDPKLVTGHAEPQGDTLRFFKFLNKERKFRIEGRTVLDLGCGTGRNSNYLANLGNTVIGIEISPTALGVAQARAKKLGAAVDYRHGDIGEPYDLPTESVDIILDVTASNSLDERGRAVYLQEMHRVLKPGGKIAILDIDCAPEYLEYFKSQGMNNARLLGPRYTFGNKTYLVLAEKK